MPLVKVGLMSLLFGTTVVLTPKPVTLHPGTVTLKATRALSPASDSMQVVVSLGVPTEDQRTKVTYGRFGPREVGNLKVRICEANGHCLPMRYSGAYVAADYGLAYDLTSPAIGKARFTSVKLETTKTVPHAMVILQNYLKLSAGR
jgi:hypothetical protein